MPKLLDQVRDAIRTLHYSIRTEEAYLLWVKKFILFHHKRHPLEMGEQEVNLRANFVGPRLPMNGRRAEACSQAAGMLPRRLRRGSVAVHTLVPRARRLAWPERRRPCPW